MKHKFPVGSPGERLERGVYVMAGMGEQFEIMLFAVRADGRVLDGHRGLIPCPPGANSLQISEDLFDRLEAADPDTRSRLRVVS